MRPAQPLIAATPHAGVRRRLALTWGVEALLVPPTTDTDERLAATVEGAVAAGWVKEGDVVVVVSGSPIGAPGKTNLIRVETV
jgi:pyruvate kinase